jgi:hypothetical protein
MLFRNLVQVLLIVVFSSMVVSAQEEEQKEEPKLGWENQFIGTFNLAQTALSNWTQGGENSWNWQLNLNGKFLNRQENYEWANTIKMIYGQARIGSDELKKSDDELFLETVYTYKVWNGINPYVAATALTQFTPGYDYGTDPKTKISDLLDPGYFRESIGLDYKVSETFKTRFGFALKQTVADEFAARWSDDPETTDEVEKLRNEVGAESVTDFSVNLSELIIYVTKLELFSNLNRIDEIDVRWDNLFSAKVADYLAVSFNFNLFYDKDISLKRQLKQTLSVGLTYSFL